MGRYRKEGLMARRSIEADGVRWIVEPSGRTTQYLKDEFGLVFRHGTGDAAVRRIIRYSPLGVRSRELSFDRLTDAQLHDLFARSQPAWTSPDLEYDR